MVIQIKTFSQKTIYLCSGPDTWNLSVSADKTIAGHQVGKFANKTIIWPKAIDSRIINPKNLDILRKQIGDSELLIIDRLKGVEGWVAITDHVNRAGVNFLTGNTPYGNMPQFPDMSRMYQTVKNFDLVTVHTVGPERFTDPPEEGFVWSEAVGLVAPIACYVGFRVWAVGGTVS